MRVELLRWQARALHVHVRAASKGPPRRMRLHAVRCKASCTETMHCVPRPSPVPQFRPSCVWLRQIQSAKLLSTARRGPVCCSQPFTFSSSTTLFRSAQFWMVTFSKKKNEFEHSTIFLWYSAHGLRLFAGWGFLVLLALPCVLGGWGFACCLQSPIRSRGRLPLGLGSSKHAARLYTVSYTIKK